MLGDVVIGAASRATHEMVEDVSKKAAWAGLGIVVALLGIVFSMMVAFWLLEPYYGAVLSAGMIAIGCFLVAGICFLIPRSIDRRRRRRQQRVTQAVAQTASAVQEKVDEVVDHMGAFRVVGSGFMLGYGLARRIKA